MPPDSSSSETGGKDTPPETVHFTLGDGEVDASSQTTTAPQSNTSSSTIPSPMSMAIIPKPDGRLVPLLHPVEHKHPSEEKLTGVGVAVSPVPASTGMTRSYSQDANMLEPTAGSIIGGPNATTSSFLTKTSYSENSLETAAASAPAEKLSRLGHLKKSLRDLPTVMSLDEETLSTDSNSTQADNDEQKKRRRKLHFPAFRKSKNKPS